MRTIVPARPPTTNTPENFRAPDLEHNHWPAHWLDPTGPEKPIDGSQAQSQSPATKENDNGS